MEKVLTIKETAEMLKVSLSTLRRWDSEGVLTPVRTSGRHRRYKMSDIKKFLGENLSENEIETNTIRVVTYARCSTFDQKKHGDIDRQSDRLVNYSVRNNYTITDIIKDCGSGLNDNRKGYIKLCNLVINRKIDKVIIEHRDRLTRFGYDTIERFFNSYGVTIELVDKKVYTETEELTNDMMMLLASFSGKLYSQRARENRKIKNSM